jgi:hypothetical protein
MRHCRATHIGPRGTLAAIHRDNSGTRWAALHPGGITIRTACEASTIMTTDDKSRRRAEATATLHGHLRRGNTAQVVEQLDSGLRVLRDSCFRRIHQDVQREFGLDSMLAPLASLQSEDKARSEIEVYQIVESALTADRQGYIDDVRWYLDWLLHLRLGSAASWPRVTQRVEQYWEQPDDERRRSFSILLERAFPEARRAPLTLYRLLPLAVEMATAVAFDDLAHAESVRQRQCEILPSIGECGTCRGAVLDAGATCGTCGNPLWTYEWLTAE